MTKLQAIITFEWVYKQYNHRQHCLSPNIDVITRHDHGGGRHHRRPHLHRYSRRPLCIPSSTGSSTGDNTEQKLEPQNHRQVFILFTNHINNKRGNQINSWSAKRFSQEDIGSGAYTYMWLIYFSIISCKLMSTTTNIAFNPFWQAASETFTTSWNGRLQCWPTYSPDTTCRCGKIDWFNMQTRSQDKSETWWLTSLTPGSTVLRH